MIKIGYKDLFLIIAMAQLIIAVITLYISL